MRRIILVLLLCITLLSSSYAVTPCSCFQDNQIQTTTLTPNQTDFKTSTYSNTFARMTVTKTVKRADLFHLY